VKLDSKVGRAASASNALASARKTNPGLSSATQVTPPTQVAFPSSQGPETSLPVSVITALKSGCASIEQLLQLTSFLLTNGALLEATHPDVVNELFGALRRFVHSPHIPANHVRSARLLVLRLLEIRQHGWTTAPAADAYYKQNVPQLAETSEHIPNSSNSSTPRDSENSRPSSSLSNHDITAKKPPQEEAWESLGMESLAIRETNEDSAFKEANNATGTPAVRQFNCLPQGMTAPGEAAMPANPAFVPVNGIAHAATPLTHARDPGRPNDHAGKAPDNNGPITLGPPPTISTANLHSRYLTNSKGQTLIISACSPLIVGMAENILLRQIPTLQSTPTQLEMETKPKRPTKDGSVQCDLLHDKSFGTFGAPAATGASTATPTLPSVHHSPTSASASSTSATVDLFVRHLHESVDDRVLFGAFEQCEDLVNARVQTDDDGYSKGYGFVSFGCLEAAQKAAAAMNGAELRTKRLFVDLAKRKEEMKAAAAATAAATSEREHDDHQNRPGYSHFTKPTYQRTKSESSNSGGRSANRQIDDPFFDDTDICGVEEFGFLETGTPANLRDPRVAPPRDAGGVKWHVTGKSRGVAPPIARDHQDRPASAMRVSMDPRGRYCEDDDDDFGEEDGGRRSGSPDSPRAPLVIGPWLKMALHFAGKGGADGDLNEDPQPMEKLLEDIPKPREGDKYRQFLLALSLSPLSQEPPMENWEVYCRQQNDCCVENMSEAFHPLRYLDYWERTSPQERHNRRPAYEEHDHRKQDFPSKAYEEHDHRKQEFPARNYEEHDCRKVDYSKIYEEIDRRKEVHGKLFGPPKPLVSQARVHPERPPDSFLPPPVRTPTTPTDKDLPAFPREATSGVSSTVEASSDFTVVTALDSADDVVLNSKSRQTGMPTSFEGQSTIICEDQLSALLSSDFDDDTIDKGAMGDTVRTKVLSSTATTETSFFGDVSGLANS